MVNVAPFAVSVTHTTENQYRETLGHPEGFENLIDSASPVFAWRVWGTLSGRLDSAEAWVSRSGTAPVSMTERLNAYGISDAVGNVRTWGADRFRENAYEILPPENPYDEPFDDSEIIVQRGGSWNEGAPVRLRAGYRDGSSPGGRYNSIGLRVGARVPA